MHGFLEFCARRGAVILAASIFLGLFVPPLASVFQDFVTITVAGMYSRAYRDAVEAANKRLFGFPPTMLDHPMFRPQRDAADMEVLVAVTLEWQGITADGVELDFTDEAVAAVYRRFQWIREQVTKAIHDPKGFPATRSTWAPPAAVPKPPRQPDFSKW